MKRLRASSTTASDQYSGSAGKKDQARRLGHGCGGGEPHDGFGFAGEGVEGAADDDAVGADAEGLGGDVSGREELLEVGGAGGGAGPGEGVGHAGVGVDGPADL